jgi:hypothetical protein
MSNGSEASSTVPGSERMREIICVSSPQREVARENNSIMEGRSTSNFIAISNYDINPPPAHQSGVRGSYQNITGGSIGIGGIIQEEEKDGGIISGESNRRTTEDMDIDLSNATMCATMSPGEPKGAIALSTQPQMSNEYYHRQIEQLKQANRDQQIMIDQFRQAANNNYNPNIINNRAYTNYPTHANPSSNAPPSHSFPPRNHANFPPTTSHYHQVIPRNPPHISIPIPPRSLTNYPITAAWEQGWSPQNNP